MIPLEYTQSYRHVPTDYPSKRSSKLAKFRLSNRGDRVSAWGHLPLEFLDLPNLHSG